MADYDVIEAFKVIEDELIASMIRNLDHHRAEETIQGLNWTQWQVEQLNALEIYRKNNQKKFGKEFESLNGRINQLIRDNYSDGATKQERKILLAIQNGYKTSNPPAFTGKAQTAGEFFGVNDRKLEALITATTHDMEKAETAVLRLANDKYRKAIFNAQVYANAGGTTYAKAVDMATRDMLRAGLNCVEYKNGARHTLSDYADMAIKTANKRAYLQGEGEQRKKWGIHTVILNKRTNACHLCGQFAGRVFIDDVWSGGSKDSTSPITGIKYPLLSEAIKQGLYHPRCKDHHTTYFEGVSTVPKDSKYTAEELNELAHKHKKEEKEAYAKTQAEKCERIGKYSLDPDNKLIYNARAEQWREKEKSCKAVAKSGENGIINSNKEETVVNDVHKIGVIDVNKYKCVTEDIKSNEVIITDERIQHIKDRHPNDYEKYCEYMNEVISNPDYIIEANKPSTALILKSFSEGNEQFKTILRLVTSSDNSQFKNSIITFMKINEKEWQRLLRNKKILYKLE